MAVQWATPLALAALLLVAVPIALHLFSRTPVVRVLVPSLRLLKAQVPRLKRRRRIRDPWLLAVRIGIVTAAVLAAAGPFVLTQTRRASWEARTVRAIVVTQSTAGDAAIASGITDERVGATASEVFTVAALDAGIAPATAWLAQQPPAQRELVFVGRGTWEHLDARVADAVPSAVGIRLRAVPGVAPTLEPFMWRGADGGGRPVAAGVTVVAGSSPATATVSSLDPPVLPVDLAAAPDDADLVSAVWEGVLASGAFLRPSTTWRSVRVEWPGASNPTADSHVAALNAEDRAGLGPLMSLVVDAGATPQAVGPWSQVSPTLQIARRDDTLVLRVSAPPEPAAVEPLLRAVLDIAAAADPDPDGGGPWSAALRQAVERAPGGIDDAAIARLDERDGRWLWVVAALGLAIETVLRRRRVEAAL